MGMELEEEIMRMERQMAESEAYISKELIPAAYGMHDMMEFFESSAPKMFVNVRGRNYLLKREAVMRGDKEMAY